MAYSTTQKEARYKIRDGQEGSVITRWYRNVERDDEGNPTGVVIFEGLCEEAHGEGRCVIYMCADECESGEFKLEYLCDGAKCEGGECALQYSMDDEEYLEVTSDQPSPDVSCYFRCQCNGAE